MPGMVRLCSLTGMGLVWMFCLASCGSGSTQEMVGEALHVDVMSAVISSEEDTHGGFHGDGETYIVLTFEDDSLEDQIKGSSHWKPLPMDICAETLAYGGSYGVELSNVKDGYYCLMDRHSDKEKDILERYSVNITLGLYDSEAETLYYYELDT